MHKSFIVDCLAAIANLQRTKQVNPTSRSFNDPSSGWMALSCFRSQASVRDVDDVALLGELFSARGKIVCLVLAGILFHNVRIGTGNNE